MSNQPSHTDIYRMMFYALLNQAMTYREKYWKTDNANAWAECNEQLDELAKSKFTMAQRLKIKKKLISHAHDFEREQEAFNKEIGKFMDKMEGMLSEENKIAFNNFAAAYGEVAHQLAMAGNREDFVNACIAFNTAPKENVPAT